MPPPLSALSEAKATLLAASLASTADFPRLRRLAAARILSDQQLLLVLLLLPETAPPASYTPFLEAILSHWPASALDPEDVAIDTASVEKLSEKAATRKLAQLLPALGALKSAPPSVEDLVTAFLLTRADRIDSETGALSIVAELLEPFVARLQPVRELYHGAVEVLYKLVYEFAREDAPGLAEFGAMHAEEAIEALIADPETVVRDLSALVEPYMAVRADGSWKAVWARLEKLEFGKLVAVICDWTPPEAVRAEFTAWAVRVCYHCTESDNERVWEGMHAVHRKVFGLLGSAPESGKVPEAVGDLNDRTNLLFQPTRAALGLLDVIITASALLRRSLAETVRLRLEGTADIQKAVLMQYVRPPPGSHGDWNKRDDVAWRKIRDGARWLRDKAEVLSQLSIVEVERIVLSGMLAGTRFGLVRDIYVTGNATSGLSIEDVEKCVLSAFNDFVDNASNGNKHRGSMKNALQAIQTLYPHTSASPALTRANRLISAMHALSNYTLPSGPNRTTPLLPVHIRIFPDPVSLISKVLDANPRSYQRPDALVEIAQDLTPDLSPAETAARVLGMCVEAALGADDFETAYAYVSGRLLAAAQRAAPGADARSTLWRTALHAGRFRSAYSMLSGTLPRGPAALALLEKKRELLAWALAYCPAEALADVLAAWARNEDDVGVLLAAEEQAEAAHVRVGGARRASVARGDDGPQSLFAVAKGAARVFTAARGDAAAGADADARERKRDVVSGMVTRGLAGGLGWVLGAQPNIKSEGQM